MARVCPPRPNVASTKMPSLTSISRIFSKTGSSNTGVCIIFVLTLANLQGQTTQMSHVQNLFQADQKDVTKILCSRFRFCFPFRRVQYHLQALLTYVNVAELKFALARRLRKPQHLIN